MGKLNQHFLTAHGFNRFDVLTETGTQSGQGIARCQHLFKELHTVEIDPTLYAAAKAKLAQYQHVHCHLGTSPSVLRQIIDASKRTLFWLDAHYVATDPSPGLVENQCPLLDELAAIFSVAWQTPPTILIDDARMFQEWFWKSNRSQGYDAVQWPKLAEIVAMAASHGYAVRQIDDVLVVEKPT